MVGVLVEVKLLSVSRRLPSPILLILHPVRTLFLPLFSRLLPYAVLVAVNFTHRPCIVTSTTLIDNTPSKVTVDRVAACQIAYSSRTAVKSLDEQPALATTQDFSACSTDHGESSPTTRVARGYASPSWPSRTATSQRPYAHAGST